MLLEWVTLHSLAGVATLLSTAHYRVLLPINISCSSLDSTSRYQNRNPWTRMSIICGELAGLWVFLVCGLNSSRIFCWGSFRGDILDCKDVMDRKHHGGGLCLGRRSCFSYVAQKCSRLYCRGGVRWTPALPFWATKLRRQRCGSARYLIFLLPTSFSLLFLPQNTSLSFPGNRFTQESSFFELHQSTFVTETHSRSRQDADFQIPHRCFQPRRRCSGLG